MSVVGHLLGGGLHAASVVTAGAGGGGGRGRRPRGSYVAGERFGELIQTAGRAGELLQGQHSGDEQGELAEHKSLEREESDDAQQDGQDGGDFDGQQSQDGQHLLLQLATACEGEKKNVSITRNEWRFRNRGLPV